MHLSRNVKLSSRSAEHWDTCASLNWTKAASFLMIPRGQRTEGTHPSAASTCVLLPDPPLCFVPGSCRLQPNIFLVPFSQKWLESYEWKFPGGSAGEIGEGACGWRNIIKDAGGCLDGSSAAAGPCVNPKARVCSEPRMCPGFICGHSLASELPAPTWEKEKSEKFTLKSTMFYF